MKLDVQDVVGNNDALRNSAELGNGHVMVVRSNILVVHRSNIVRRSIFKTQGHFTH